MGGGVVDVPSGTKAFWVWGTSGWSLILKVRCLVELGKMCEMNQVKVEMCRRVWGGGS